MATLMAGLTFPAPRVWLSSFGRVRRTPWFWGAVGTAGGFALILIAMVLQHWDDAHGLLDSQREPAMWLIDVSPALGILCYEMSRRQMRAVAIAGQNAAERRRFDEMFGALAEGVFIYGRNNGTQWVNQEGARMFLAGREELMGRRTSGTGGFVEYLRPDGSRAAMSELPTVKTFETGLAHRNHLFGLRRRRDGSVIYVRASAAPLRAASATAFDRFLMPDEVIVTYTDVTEQVLAERELAQRAREEEALNALRALLAEGAEPEALMQSGAEHAKDVLHLSAVAVFQRLPGGTDTVVASTGFSRDDAEVGDAARQALASGVSVVVAAAAAGDNAGAAGVAIPSAAGPLGVLAAFHRTGLSFTTSEVQFLEAVAGVLGWAIERAETNRHMRASEEKFRRLVESSPEPITVHTGGRLVYANAAAAAMLGFLTPAEIIGRPEEQFLHPDSMDAPSRLAAHARSEHAEEPIQLQCVRADGGVVDVEVVALPTTFEGQSAVQLMLRDVTARKQAEEALRLSQQRLSEILNIAPDAIISVNSAFQILLFNRAAEQIFGYSAPQVMGRSFVDLVPLDTQHESDFMGRFLGEPERSTHGSVYGHRRDGSEFPADASVSTAQVGDETVFTVIIRDITSRRQTEAALRAEHAQQERLLAAIPSVMVGVDGTGEVTLWNAAAERTFGIERDAALRQPLGSLGVPWEWPAVRDLMDRGATDGVSARLDRLRYRQVAGQDGFLSLTVNPVLARGGRAGFLLVADDITSRVTLEAQLAQAQKLESIGHLAAGIAHEINTPTQFVGDNTRFLKEAFTDIAVLLDDYAAAFEGVRASATDEAAFAHARDTEQRIDLPYLREEVPLAIDQALDGINRVAKIVRAMKEFSHPGTAEMTPVSLNEAITSTLTVARNEWKYVADVETDLDMDMPRVPCLPGEFNQVILNIVINAAHALADKFTDGAKGMIRVSTRTLGEWAEVEISDNGPGIPAEIQSRVFDPFFTTKEVGKGTGQGLAIARSVITNKHNGTLSLKSSPGEGATFTIRLPLATSALVA